MENIKFNSNQITASKEYNVYAYEMGGFIVPPHFQPNNISGVELLWLLPVNNMQLKSYMIKTLCYRVEITSKEISIITDSDYKSIEYPARPACDFLGKQVKFNIVNKDLYEKAYAHFYWDNLLKQIAERAFMRDVEDIRDGYVFSTLNKDAYAGTYPAVDHEFHIKGRYAVGGECERALIKRMLLLQLKIMREDPKGISRNVCAIQPNRDREYNVWRFSNNHLKRAQMFRVTANIEFIEEVYQYYCMSKDIDFLKQHIDAIERNCSYIERFIDKKDNLLNSHVYYEDQVIKNGKVTQAQCFAVNSFRLMAKLERHLGRNTKAEHYETLAQELGKAVVKPYPHGYWDNENKRFIDWIDKRGKKHDHIHLLANQLPVLFNLTDKEQADCSLKAVEENADVFNKFPSLVSAKIEDYTRSEIGNSPYDLCAAGRYWCWDATFKAYQEDGSALLKQLTQVAKEGEKDGFLMGERYDMNYVYYNTGEDAKRNWHGAALYYEYPNVFIYTLICKYLGVQYGFNEDIILTPLLDKGSVTLEIYGIEYSLDKNITVKNISDKALKISIPKINKSINLEPQESYTSEYTI